MKKNITIKDVAREAGVSVATVSYVVNNRTDMRISEATRKKVFQIINLLGYTPNQSAQALATSRKRTVALYLSPDLSVLKNAEQMHFIDVLSSFFHEKNYALIYLSSAFQEKFDHADAIIGYDISSEYFMQIGDSNFVPLLALDCMVPDHQLFFQINTDYEKVAEEAAAYFRGPDYTALLLDTPNLEKRQLLEDVFPSVTYLSDASELEGFRNRNVLLMDYSLHELLTPRMESEDLIFYAPSFTAEKAEKLFQCMEYALDRTPDVPHKIFV
ncbi:MAG: LacI family DNA-binding transcriptional regulator [Roseburia sp.]